MATSERNDPLPVFSFLVELSIGGNQAFFKGVSGIRYETETVPVKAGGVNNTTYNLVGSVKWANLVFKQGFTKSSRMLQWREEWMVGKMSRHDGTITMLDTALKPQSQWSFKRGWPCKWDISELDASKSEIAIESLEIAHDGLTYKAL